MEHPIKMDDLGVPLFLEHPNCGIFSIPLQAWLGRMKNFSLWKRKDPFFAAYAVGYAPMELLLN